MHGWCQHRPPGAAAGGAQPCAQLYPLQVGPTPPSMGSPLGGVAGAPTVTLRPGRSYLDMLKVAVFRYLFWLVLVVVFVTGATRISIFGLGYLLACFYLLLFGTALLQRDTRARLVLWDCLILYNVTVIISKNMLSVSPAPGPTRPPRLGTLLALLTLLSPSSWPASSWSRCRPASAGSSSSSALCAPSRATMTVSGEDGGCGGCGEGPAPGP